MHIATTHAKRIIRECRYCEGPILMGERIFRGRWYYYKKLTIVNWHFQCYVDQATQYLDNNPFTPRSSNGGRPNSGLSIEERKKRRSLIVQGSQLRKQMKDIVFLNMPNRHTRLAEINDKYNLVADKLKPIGGVPRKWFV